MDHCTFHSPLAPENIARALLDSWNQGATIAQAFGTAERVIVQIGQRTPGWFSNEPRQAITVVIQASSDGVTVVMDQQPWNRDGGTIVVGGLIGVLPSVFPLSLSRLVGDDAIADSLPGTIWQMIERYATQVGAATGTTGHLTAIRCPECGVATPHGAERCSTCSSALATSLRR